MNYALSKHSPQPVETNHRQARSLLTKMKALQERLDDFTVVDRHGYPVGDLRNVVLHQRQLALMIVQPDVHKHWRFVLLSSHLVERISLRDRVIFVHTTQADMSFLLDHQAMALSINSDQPTRDVTKLNAPVRQLPARLLTDRAHRWDIAKEPSSGKQMNQSEPKPAEAEPQLREAPAMPKALTSDIGVPASPSSGSQSNGSPSPLPSSIKADHGSQRSLQQSHSLTPGAIQLQGDTATLASTPMQTTEYASPQSSIKGQFTSPKQASQFLEAIAKTLSRRCKTIRLEIELDDATVQPVCQEWLNQYLSLSKN